MFTGCELNPIDEDFFGFDIYKYEGPSSSQLLTGCNLSCAGGTYFQYRPEADGGTILGAAYTHTTLTMRQYPQNIFLWDMDGIEEPETITEDLFVFNQRASRNIYPQGSDDLSLIVWENHSVGRSSDGTMDFFNIEFYNRNIGTGGLVTHSMDSTVTPFGTNYRYYSNIKPLITPNDDYIIYFVDTFRTYEPCKIQIVGGLPDTLTRTALMVEGEDYGIFYEAGVEISENTYFDWCPRTYDILAFIDEGGTLCFFYPYTETIDKLADLGQISEFAWSPDGEQFAIVTEAGLSIGMTLSGAVENVFVREKSNDEIIGITWSQDLSSDPKIVFRLVRKGRSTVDSFSSLVIYSINEDDWYFALPSIQWTREIEVDYRLNRAFIESDDASVYLPVPTAGRSVLYHSYE